MGIAKKISDWVIQIFLDILAPIFSNLAVELISVPYSVLALYMIYKPFQETGHIKSKLKDLRLGAEFLFIAVYNQIMTLGKLSILYDRLLDTVEPKTAKLNNLAINALGVSVFIILVLACLVPVEKFARYIDTQFVDGGLAIIEVPWFGRQFEIQKNYVMNFIAVSQTVFGMVVTYITYTYCRPILLMLG